MGAVKEAVKYFFVVSPIIIAFSTPLLAYVPHTPDMENGVLQSADCWTACSTCRNRCEDDSCEDMCENINQVCCASQGKRPYLSGCGCY